MEICLGEDIPQNLNLIWKLLWAGAIALILRVSGISYCKSLF